MVQALVHKGMTLKKKKIPTSAQPHCIKELGKGKEVWGTSFNKKKIQ